MATTRSGGKATLTTVWTDADVDAFIEGVGHEVRRRDARTMLELMQRVSGAAPRMWGPSVVGFGCLNLEDLAEVDLGVLEEMVRRSYTAATGDGDATPAPTQG